MQAIMYAKYTKRPAVFTLFAPKKGLQGIIPVARKMQVETN
jgi:hypothetical protein